MNLLKELDKLRLLIGTGNDFKEQLELIKSNFHSEEDKKIIDELLTKAFRESSKASDEMIEEVKLKAKIAEVSEIVSFSYIAKKYFNKSRSWLHQRLNGNIVNGKPAELTEEEKAKLNQAFKDLAEKIGSVSI